MTELQQGFPCRKCNKPLFWDPAEFDKDQVWRPKDQDGSPHKCEPQPPVLAPPEPNVEILQELGAIAYRLETIETKINKLLEGDKKGE